MNYQIKQTKQSLFMFVVAMLIVSGFFASQQAFAAHTAPTISTITTKDTNSDGRVDTATIVFSEAVDDSTFAPNDFTIGGSAGTSIAGTADDNTLDVVVAGGVAGTNAKDVTYIKSAGNGADLVGNLLANVMTGTIIEVDAAAPVAILAQTKTTTTIEVTFSENILLASATKADFLVDDVGLSNNITKSSELNPKVILNLNSPTQFDGIPEVTILGNGANAGIRDNNATNWTTEHSITATDGLAPTVSITSIAGDDYINNAEKAVIHVVGTAEAGSTVNVSLTSGATVTGSGMATDGNFDITINGATLTDGTVTPSVTATDATGNVSAADTTPIATKDITAPSVTSKTPDANAVGIDPTSNITVVFSEDVIITNTQVTLQKGSDTPVNTVVSGTGTVTIDPSVTLENNSTYTITLTDVIDTAGNTLPITIWTFTTAGSYSFTLTNGWNLVALGVVPNSNTVSTILGGSSANVESIWSYDAVTDTWSVNHPNGDAGTNTLLNMTAGNGYWINYTSSSSVTLSGSGNLFLAGEHTPPSRTLKAGWNLIGYYQRELNTTALVTNALKTLKSQDATPIPWWSMIVKHDNSAKQFGTVENSNSLSSGQGYWILMGGKATDTYIYAPGIVD